MKKAPILFLTKITDVNIVNYVGETIDKHSFQYKAISAVVNRNHLALPCSNPNHGRYQNITKKLLHLWSF